ncbi:MAG: hypothetical protein ACTH6O_00600 [Vibrio toranzoniae]|uniref:hypothetical protein n=1 Tax=Vibrio toranzoniae TaxID=1194427 RepID=UPI0013789CFB|nr:hypothetical protein [Vibrio toranzoniae]NAZ55455.1 hypothetical protein [Vibrio toranzoniae]
MAADKRDWGKIQLDWAKSGLSCAAYCKKHDIPLPSGRRYLKQAVKDQLISGKVITEEQSDQPNRRKKRKPDHSTDHDTTTSLATAGEAAKQPKGKGDHQKNKGGAPKGNQNAKIHGLLTACFGEILDYADQAGDAFKIKVFKAAQLKALDGYAKYQTQLQEYLEALPGGKPSADDLETIQTYEGRIKSCFEQATYYMSKEIQLVQSMTNTKATNVAKKKMEAQITHISVDTQLKRKGLKLTDAKTEQAFTAAALNKYELTAKEKEGLGEKDDLGMELDDIAAMDDDEINQRFKEREEAMSDE